MFMEYKAYSFDLDDNLLKLPTKTYLKNKEGKIESFTTLKFEKIRPNLEQLNLKITADSFKDFANDEQFLIDIEKSTKAGSWINLVNCIVQHASIFAIITARGHSPSALKKGMEKAIVKNLTKEQLKKFQETFNQKYKIQDTNKTPEETLKIYLDLCKFYPVTNKEIKTKFKSQDVSELKSLVFEEFRQYVYSYVEETFGKDVKIKIGFSDDSITHLKKMVNDILKKHGLFFYQTKGKSKQNFI